ncbi:MAG: response regulator receiver protein, partial [Actinomycetia bacterium]|nr:response regulator receiver protein [Actinomycetes bacterium]
MRVLFVDDDANVLSGLRRMLRGMRFEWDMQFAASGEEAIALLRSKAFDVLISDMRMPGVDGLQLLRMARDERPSVVRIVLT